MKSLIAITLSLFLANVSWASCPSFLNHDLRKLHSKDSVNLCQVQAGKPMLVVNTASHCGYTRQFKGLEALNQKYADQGLVVVGFASDDFNQEAKDEATAANVCYVNYGVTFTMLAPSAVKGDTANPVFRELARQSEAPNWNFNKYLVDADGTVIQHFGSNVRPDSKELVGAIERLL